MNTHVVENCLSCGESSLIPVIDLGLQPLANNLLTSENQGEFEPRFPLGVQVCSSCWLLQLTHLVPPVDLFSEYLYFSSFSETMLKHSRRAAEQHIERFSLDRASFVVEIASNDGYFLKNFVERGIPCLGIEPAENIAREALKANIPTEAAFFGKQFACGLVDRTGKADLILGNNVFAHVPDTNDFVAGIAALLSARGRAVLEFPYLGDLIENLEFDTIYHEHVFYFSLTALVPLFSRHGLMVERAEKLAIHGGSLRLFLSHEGEGLRDQSVDHLLREENEKGVGSPEYYSSFAERVESLMSDLKQCLLDLKADGSEIAAYGASAKGSTLLNFINLPESTLSFIVDRSHYKQGRLSPGLHLPIVAPEALLEKMPEYTLLLTWNFREEILLQQQAYRDKGGKFIIPIPEVEIV